MRSPSKPWRLASEKGFSIDSTAGINLTVPADVQRLVDASVTRFGRI